MEYCNRCGMPLPSNTDYCTRCGARRIRPSAFSAPEPLPYAPPVMPPQTVTAPPVYASAPPAEKPSKPGQGYGIAGMILGIAATAVSGLVFLYCLFFGSLIGVLFGGRGFIASMALGSQLIPYIVEFPILGLCFSLSARKQGYICNMSTVGVVLSCVGFGIQGVMLLFGMNAIF